jgi:hypothetical protein
MLIKQGKLNPESVSVKNYQGDLDISIGEKIVFKQNNSR